MMRVESFVVVGFLYQWVVVAHDYFNYGMDDLDAHDGPSYGQPHWNEVTCSNVETCTGYPDNFPFAFLSLDIDSECKWCPEDKSEDCGDHRQSPINLKRNVGMEGSEFYVDCPDWHWIHYTGDTCTFDDVRDHFSIERHALQIHTPQQDDGDLDCKMDGERKYARVDFSKGFPHWWYLQRTDIMIPSQHTQEGIRYAAEVVLAHFYSREDDNIKLAHVSYFLQDYEDAESWAYLDKLICAWRKVEEEVREACGLDPAPPYGRCQLWRDQEPTEEWLQEAGLLNDANTVTEQSLTDLGTGAPSEPTIILPDVFSNLSTFFPTPGVSNNLTSSPTTQATSATIVPTLEATSNPSSTPTIEPSFAATSFPSFGPTTEPTLVPTSYPSSVPTMQETSSATTTVNTDYEQNENSTLAPTFKGTIVATFDLTLSPTGQPSNESLASESALEFDCKATGIDFKRMCDSADPCCESTRSDTTYCWEKYEALGENVAAACYNCCSSPKIVGPPNPPLPNVPMTVQCSALDNSRRICKENSCCSNPRSTSSYCQSIYAAYGDDMEQICHYCCRIPRTIGPAIRRNLRAEPKGSTNAAQSKTIPEGAKEFYVGGRRFLVRAENFEPPEEDEDAYFRKLQDAYNTRSLQSNGTIVHEEDYEDIEWFPYEWMLKVGTEYYFRYEGSMVVPPCYETVHWRIFKDPIKVHKRQIDELNRLLAWRLNKETCEVDTSGVLSDDGNRIEANRAVQYLHEDKHNMVFCECKDWPSKFEGDAAWCNAWSNDIEYDRFYKRPYSFESNGQWLPDHSPYNQN